MNLEINKRIYSFICFALVICQWTAAEQPFSDGVKSDLMLFEQQQATVCYVYYAIGTVQLS